MNESGFALEKQISKNLYRIEMTISIKGRELFLCI